MALIIVLYTLPLIFKTYPGHLITYSGSLSTKKQAMTRFRSVLTPDSVTFQNATLLSEYDCLFSVF